MLGMERKLTSVANDCRLRDRTFVSPQPNSLRVGLSWNTTGRRSHFSTFLQFFDAMFLKKRRHEPWHSCIELSATYNVTKFKARLGRLVIPKAEICDADHIIQRIDGLGYAARSLCPHGKAFMAWSVLGVH
jgi:hypothetical protein